MYLFLIRGEVENADQKKQLDPSRNFDERKSTLGTWHHDAVLVMKVGNKLVQVAFGEVIGNASNVMTRT